MHRSLWVHGRWELSESAQHRKCWWQQWRWDLIVSSISSVLQKPLLAIDVISNFWYSMLVYTHTLIFVLYAIWMMVAKDHFARALTIWMEFLVYFFWTNGTALFFHWGNKIDWAVSFDQNFWMPVSLVWAGVWVHVMSTRNMESELPLVLDVLSDDLEIVFSFLEKTTISSF